MPDQSESAGAGPSDEVAKLISEGIAAAKAAGGVPEPDKRALLAELLGRHLAANLPEGATIQNIEMIRHDQDRPAIADADLPAFLRAAAARYGGDCEFGVGDLIIPRAHSNYQSTWSPSVVCEVLATPKIVHEAESPYCRNDIVILRAERGSTVTFLAESWQFEAWAPAADK